MVQKVGPWHSLYSDYVKTVSPILSTNCIKFYGKPQLTMETHISRPHKHILEETSKIVLFDNKYSTKEITRLFQLIIDSKFY